jgi:tetratricopeptide (TPR) repeat protein
MSNAQMFFQLIRNSRKHNTISNKSGAILQIGNIAAYDNQPRTAIKYYKEALSMFPARSSNSIRVAYAIISCNVLLEQYEKAMSIVDSLKELVFKIGDSAILNTWLYRKAYLSHLLNDNKVALRILTSELSVSSKDEEWFFASRFLELQCLWADREYDVYDSRIISLRRNPLYKNIKRNNRNYIISQLLSQLSTTQYKSRRFKIEEGIEALNGNDINYRWDPYGFELLRFEKWWWSSAKV